MKMELFIELIIMITHSNWTPTAKVHLLKDLCDVQALDLDTVET